MLTDWFADRPSIVDDPTDESRDPQIVSEPSAVSVPVLMRK